MRRIALAGSWALLFWATAADARFWRAPGFVDWFVSRFARIHSSLDLDAEQERRLREAKKPLLESLEEAQRVERRRVADVSALFDRDRFPTKELERLMEKRRARRIEFEARLRRAAIELIAAMHRILTPAQRKKVVAMWARLIERRYVVTERPLH
jgi:Spy/CpxP family protein refolding chaperone